MGYLGNNLQAAYSSYLLIDSLTASFNGTTTSFPLRVNGITPVPFPVNEQNVLISVGGVPQKPDPTGSEGFRFSGSNIVFSSAPKTGEAFWGVVLAGADYINVGADFPDGSVSAPSITFASEKSTGFYKVSSGTVGVALNGSLGPLFTGSGVYLNNTNNGLYSPGTNELALSTSGAERVRIDSSGRLLIGTSTSGTSLLQVNAQASANGNAFRSVHRIADSGTGLTQTNTAAPYISYLAGLSAGQNATAIAIVGEDFAGGNNGLQLELNYIKSTGAVASGDRLGRISFGGDDATNVIPAAQIAAFVDDTPGTNDMPGRLVFSTTANGAAAPTERVRITSSGNVGIGNTNPGVPLHVNGSIANGTTNGAAILLNRSGYSTSTTYGFYNNDTTGISNPAANVIGFCTVTSERARITSTGELLIGTTTTTANGGVLQVSNGVTFPATQVACTDVNTLDDYEEGTWTASLGGTATYTANTGTYVKIGKFVFWTVDFWVNTIGTGSTNTISGLPFTVGTKSSGTVSSFSNLSSNQITVVPFTNNSGTSIVFYGTTTAVAGNTTLAIFGNNTRMYISGCYPV